MVSVALVAALLAAILVLMPGCGGGGNNPQVPFPGGVVWNPAGLTAADKAISATGWELTLELQGDRVVSVEASYPGGVYFDTETPPVEFAPNKVTSMGLSNFALADWQAGGKGVCYILIQSNTVWVFSLEASLANNTDWKSAGPATGYVAAQVSGGKVVLSVDGQHVDRTINLPDFS